MTQHQQIKETPPTELGPARALAHGAAQLLTKAARANLEASPDDSHSNLGWDGETQRFVSQPLHGANGEVYVGLSLSPFELTLIDVATGTSSYQLTGHTFAEAAAWLDDALESVALKRAADVSLPYDLPSDVAAIARVPDALPEGLASLAGWFDLAGGALERLAADQAELTPGPSPVRCWPHHFDIATYVSLETGDAETAKGIGVGMSPGDESYAQPYFYVNPWPHLDASALPDAPAPGHWHTQGFVGAIATGDEVLSTAKTAKALSDYLENAFSIGHTLLMK
ncbi:hypothetical protein QMT40_000207 [Parvibaculaceae bacterium PLY_AMNH_Bact1]|nr:hypothetical protein QMT40_000207 [Parvibaculaceae bacterium PLY_AMNH_Bact1]